VVHARARWVVERLRQKSALPSPPPPRELVSGEGYRYLGRQLRLRLLVDAPPAPVILRQGWLELPLPVGLPEEQRRPTRGGATRCADAAQQPGDAAKHAARPARIAKRIRERLGRRALSCAFLKEMTELWCARDRFLTVAG
jgi:hypothetical protein